MIRCLSMQYLTIRGLHRSAFRQGLQAQQVIPLNLQRGKRCLAQIFTDAFT